MPVWFHVHSKWLGPSNCWGKQMNLKDSNLMTFVRERNNEGIHRLYADSAVPNTSILNVEVSQKRALNIFKKKNDTE